MGHRIFTGSFETLEAKWLEEVSRLKQDDPLAPVTVLVGSNLLASYLKRQVALHGKATANIHFCTFLDLVRRLAASSDGSSRKPPLSNLGAATILESLLATQIPQIFRSVAGFPGFRSALLDTFRDLRDASVSPRDLEEGVRRCVAEVEDRRRHLLGLLHLYRHFRHAVQRFHGVDDEFRLAAGNADSAPGILRGDQLLVYGMYDVTGQQSDLLRALGKTLEIAYFIPFVDDSVSEFASRFLESREEELGVRAMKLPPGASSDTLHVLGRTGFCLPSRAGKNVDPGPPAQDRPPPDDTVALVSAPGESRAAVEAVREILRAVRDGVIGTFSEAALIVRQPDAELPLLTEALRLRNIPYFVQGGIPFARRPFARALLSIARLESNSYSRQSVFTAMEWLSASLPADSAAFWDVSGWRALTADLPLFSGIRAWDEGVEGLVRKAARDLKLAEEASANIIAEVAEEDQRTARSLPVSRRILDSARELRTAWLELRRASANWPESLSWADWARFLAERLEALMAQSGDWSSFSTALDEISSLDEVAALAGTESRVSGARLISALEESLSTLSCPEGRFMRSGVNLISTAAARGLRFPLVIVPGLEEGKFPARLRQDPLLFDGERLKIGNPSRLPLKSQRGQEEKLLFDMAARSAKRRLVLITSRLDEASDRERLPSEFLLRFAAALSGAPVGLGDLAEGTVPRFRSVSLDNPAPREGEIAVDRGEIRLRLVARSSSPRAILKGLAAAEPALVLRPLLYDDARWQPRLTAFDGRISDPDLVAQISRLVGPEAGPVSASRLESYAKCPYLFFLKRVMGLEAWEEPETRQAWNPMDRGQAIHAILESFLGKYEGKAFARASTDQLTAELEKIARLELDNSRPAGMHDLIWEIEREGLERLLFNWLEFERARGAQGLLPSHFERPFGRFSEKEAYPDLPIEAGRHKFIFRGRIDRIDISDDGETARVIDYKTGRLPETMARRNRQLLMAGEKMQVALYHGVLRLLVGLGNVESVTGEFQHLQPRDGKVVLCSYSENELREATDRLTRILEIIGDGIETGVFFPRTAGAVRPDGHCRWCDFLNVCGKDRRLREERKAIDPSVMRFGRISKIDAPGETGE